MSFWHADSDLDYRDEFWRKPAPDAPRTVPNAEDIARAEQHAERRRYEGTGVGGSLETRIERFKRRMGQ